VNSLTVQVPATTANLGPGFDVLGIALQLYNRITLSPGANDWPDPFIQQAADLFYEKSELNKKAFHISIEGDVPRSRGLGSSVTVRLGLLTALNLHHHTPLSPEQILQLVIQLEGHPDNAVPAALGGFAACTPQRWFRTPVEAKLNFIALVPTFEVETKKARSVLPNQIPLADAVKNLQNTAQIVAAFASHDYSMLRGHFSDALHQPYRAPLIPGCEKAFDLAEKAGALGAFISGSGSTLMALTLNDPKPVIQEWSELFSGQVEKIHLLQADNQGVQAL
jgi:homoserine kinase